MMKPKMIGSNDHQSKKGKASLNRREEMNAAGKHSVVIGIDEAGRGPLCGPVVAAACIIPYFDDLVIDGIIDSKKLTDEKEREVIYGNLISDTRVMWFASIVSNEEIDAVNILQASLAAMRRATEGLIKKYSLTDHSSFIALIDGNKIPESMPVASKCIIKGDGHIFSIAAASIIAKVTRDRIMIALDKKYPIYGLAKHKGYPTASHRSALYEHGPCEIYRMSYLPVKKAIERTQLASVGRLEAIVNGQSDTKSIDDSIVSHPNRKRKNRGTNDEKSAKRSTSTTEMKTGLNIQSEGPLGREKNVVKMATRADDDSFFDREKNQFTMNNEGSDSLTPMRLDSREKKDIIPVISRLRRSSRLLKVV